MSKKTQKEVKLNLICPNQECTVNCPLCNGFGVVDVELNEGELDDFFLSYLALGEPGFEKSKKEPMSCPFRPKKRASS